MKKAIVAGALALVVGGVSIAHADQLQGVYAGGGLGYNSFGSGWDDAVGFQVFGGYQLDELVGDMGDLSLAVEIGYMNSGDFEREYCLNGWMGYTECYSVEFDAKGIWSTAVVSYPVAQDVDLLGRLGLDFGDDDGLMFGAGVGYSVTNEIQLRGEYVIRDNIDSLQANLAYFF